MSESKFGTLLSPGENIKPIVNLELCSRLIKKLYGFKCIDITELNSYDDKNFKVITNDNQLRVLKIMNSMDSKKLDVMDGQTAMSLFLADNGMNCSRPVQNLHGKYFSVENMESGEHVVRLMIYIEGCIFHETPISNTLFYDVGKYLANVDNILENFSHPAYETHKSVWMLECLPQLRDFLYVIKDPQRVTMIEDVICDFERSVIPEMSNLQKGMIHGDFNEQNIIVECSGGDYKISGILDFGDSQKSCYLFELAVCLTYMLIVGKEFDIGGHVLAGYESLRKVNQLEFSLLKVCIMARLSQSLVLGAYTSSLDPENTYLLSTSNPGWDLFFKLNSVSNIDLQMRWKAICDSYKEA